MIKENKKEFLKFSLIIPAYNEEESIGSVIERCIVAKEAVLSDNLVDDLEIIIVNDGSSDSTADIAGRYCKIRLLDLKENRGYGAALKEGFKFATGNILGFMDADGTCDPGVFKQLIEVLLKENASVVIGSRLGMESQMPYIRRLGNNIYAKIINFLANVKITDSASGMRVFRRETLRELYPLPDGLHFTPVMSCKALMSGRLKILEVPISYSERSGGSKLNIIKDGQRFLKSIFEVALIYRPFKLLFTIGIVFLLISIAYSIKPIIYYLNTRSIHETHIYRLISISTFFITGINFVLLALLSDELVSIITKSKSLLDTYKNKLLYKLLLPRNFIKVSFLLAFMGVMFNIETIKEYVTTGKIFVHWVFVLTGSFLVLFGVQIFVFGFLRKILLLHKERVKFLNEQNDIN